MRIAEIFRSRQGEGRLTGTESIFVRVSGCNLRCGYCDTKYASWLPEGEEMSVEAILGRIHQLAHDGGVRHIVLTGGEPMLFAEMVPLTTALRAEGWHLTIETSGTLYLPVACDLMSMSPKLSNSRPLPDEARHAARHESNRHEPEVIARLVLEYEYQVKFVVGTLADCAEVESYLSAIPQIDRRRVMLMPQGIESSELDVIAQWLEPYCEEHQLLFCPRKHVQWYGPGRGK